MLGDPVVCKAFYGALICAAAFRQRRDAAAERRGGPPLEARIVKRVSRRWSRPAGPRRIWHRAPRQTAPDTPTGAQPRRTRAGRHAAVTASRTALAMRSRFGKTWDSSTGV